MTESARTVVIGGGVAGASGAHHLTARGRAVGIELHADGNFILGEATGLRVPAAVSPRPWYDPGGARLRA